VNSTSGHRIRKLTKGRTQCRRLSALRRDWGRVVLSAKSYPHKYAEAGARTRDLPVTDGRLYHCTRPALPTDKLFGKKKSSDSYMYTTILARHFPPLLLQPMGTMVIQNLSCFPTLLESNGSQWASNSTNTKN